VGDRLVKVPASALDHRRFWDAMDSITDSQLVEIERRVTARVVECFRQTGNTEQTLMREQLSELKPDPKKVPAPRGSSSGGR
jgi:hypothetical protein